MKHHNFPNFKIRFTLLIFALLLLSFTIGDSKSEYNLPRKAFSVSFSDIDLDNDFDIIVGHKTAWQDTNKTLSLLDNYQSGNFSILDTSKTFCGYQENIFAIKINGDEYPDIVTFYSNFSSGTAARYIRIFYNENGEFNNFTNFNLNSSETFSTINYGDINGDDYFDLLVISNHGKFWGVLYNDGTGNFSSPQYYNISDYYPSDIACGDLNDDGREDIIIGGKTEIFFSYQSGFQSLFFDIVTGHVEVADFDFDGDNDIIGAIDLYPGNSNILHIIENLGDENFLIHDPIIFEPICHFYFTISDFNNDSLPDLLFHPMNHDNLLVFYNNGNFTLSEPQFIPMDDYGETTRRSACADFDGNGFNDIVTIRSWGAPLPANVNILFNDGNGNFVKNPITNIETPDSKLQTPNLHCYPNPFTDKTTIEIGINNYEQIKLDIYNIQGKLIRTFIDKKLHTGEYKFIWNSKDNNGKEVKPGLYLIRLQSVRPNGERAGRNVNTKRLVFIK